jgi:putative ABC transport system permease protein
MSVIWYKVWSDLWDNKIRTILAVLSIAAGVFAVGAIFGMVDQLMVGMDTAHRAVNPSHLRLVLADYISRDTANRLEHIDGVEAIELLEQTTVRYKLSSDPEAEWRSSTVSLREDYDDPTYEVLQLKAGEWPDKRRVAVERLTSQYFGMDIGDHLIFETKGSNRVLPVVGVVRDSFVPPPQFGGPAAFYVGEQGLERFDIPQGEFGQLLIRVTPYSPELARQVASEIKNRLAKEGIDVGVTFYQDPDKHWGRPFVTGLNLVLQLLAVLSLFMSVVLIVNTLTALITQQTYQIGIIKAVGGTTGEIIKIYLAGVLVYGLLALLMALPLGALLAFGLTQWFLNLFNIDYEVFQVSTRALVLQVIAAIIAPLLAALWPVLQGATVTVRQAIASYGLGSDFGHNPFDRLVERLGQRWLPGPYAVAWGNMFRHKGRLILTQFGLTTAGVMFLVIMSQSASIKLTLDNYLDRRKYDVEITFQNNQRIDRVARLAHWFDAVEEAQVWFRQPASILKEGQRAREAGVGAFMYGIPVENQIFQPLMVAGRWLRPGDGRVIVISEGTARDNDIQVGDTVTVDLGKLGSKADWQVVGLFQVVLGGGFSVDPIYAPQQAVFAATTKHNVGDSLYIRLSDPARDSGESMVVELQNLFARRKLAVMQTDTTQQFREAIGRQFGITTNMLFALALIVALVGGIGLMGSLSISVVERTKEIGVMRAIGARTRTIMGMFVMEGLLQGLFSWVVAVPSSFVLGRPLTRALGEALEVKLDYQYSVEAVMYWFVAILMISALASVLPARAATQISVRDSLAYA